MIRNAETGDFERIFTVINDAAMAYKGFIPDDRWHEPYMERDELRQQISEGVNFFCWIEDGIIIGVMGIQDKGDVFLIRHAYVLSSERKKGIGTMLLQTLVKNVGKPVLIGTWEAAFWAIQFYEKNGFSLVSAQEKNNLLLRYWDVPVRQRESSVVLADDRYRALLDRIAILPYTATHSAEVIGLILDIQRNEFALPITVEDQPDLDQINSFYRSGIGNFWVAENSEGHVIGTIALKDIGNNRAALRKMFVKKEYRGCWLKVAHSLLLTLVSWSRAHAVRDIYLGTTDKFLAAQRFYEKNGFRRIVEEDLPDSFSVMKVDSVFYTRSLDWPDLNLGN